MASTINSMPAANNASGNAVNAQSSGARQTLRSSASTRASDGSRRQSGSPLDGGQRRSNSQKAWSQNTNPMTQRSSYAQQNGNLSQRHAASPRASPRESNTPDNHAHDRLVFLLTSFIGLTATVTTRSGEKFTGIFSSSALEPSESTFVLKMVQRPSKSEQHRSNGVSEASSPFMGSAPDHSMSFDFKDVADISVPNVSTADVTVKGSNGASVGFKTDADISGNLAIRERTLKRWEPAADTDVDLSLETSNNSSGWDQFETNARLFGATSSYDENMYTTRIDKSDPTYKQKQADAARIAREIEGTNTDNAHVREERGMVSTDDIDEEAKYSGVRRDERNFPPLVSGQPNKYTPPARRQNAVQPAVATGAPAGAVKQTPGVPKDAITTGPPKENGQTPAQPAPADTTAATTATEQKPALSKPPSGVTAPAPANATSNVEAEVLDSFRQFAHSEKAKLQERRRNQASYDRTLKLNELMKFSKNFKLATPVPKDLVPILAKDPHKQEEIIQRAQQHAEEKTVIKTPESTAAEPKPAVRAPGAAHQEAVTMPPPAQPDHQNYPRGRQMYPPAGPAGRLTQPPAHPGRQATGMLGHRLADNIQQRKGTAMGSVPAPLPIQEVRIPPTGPAGDQPSITSPNKSHTPTSAVSTKFNVKALEFKPNPAATTFTPGASSTSSPFARGRSVSRATSPSAFFGTKKPRPISERPSLNDQFNPIKRMKKESAAKGDKDYTFNGGIPPAYKTLPTWDVSAGNEEKTYLQMFKSPVSGPAISPQSRSASNPQIPHPPQMPFQFPQGTPGMPPTSGPPHGPHLHPQQHHNSGPPHFDDPHRMQMSASTSQMFPSPRLQHGYPSPMAPHAQLAFGQGVPQFYMNQGGPQPAHMRHYPGAPQFVNPQSAMGAPMMVQQPSSGPYMGVPQGVAPYTPQMQMYSPNPSHAYPQHAPPPQPHSGYPSPSRGAPMMMHQNSQPGQPPQPVMFMSPGQHGQPVYPAQQPGHSMCQSIPAAPAE
ncbi:PAB1 binding protein [Aspergillus heteromorphus CBS 117.55]|uniref:PAB1 binding protein n=1 Tax=Aspergillus heteromorphus CBS 117.55 TaxID=1448321 RepID=A0A317W7J8_9EURO|nr:PAB1 binding protein [Aspergillus heteromorphus CBS 117.55]PWY81855.1 PAB1 binding protein [Aspergillus heteromorphus CBS 117.55]